MIELGAMVSIMCTMTMVLLLTLAWSVEGDNEQVVEERTVVVEIEDVNQPYNCSAFFDSLEVRFLLQTCANIVDPPPKHRD